MDAVSFIFRAELRRRWRSWAAVALLVAVVSGVAMAAIEAGNRTATVFPRFVAAHGYDAVVVSNTPSPRLARLPEVGSAVEAVFADNGQPTCACRGTIDYGPPPSGGHRGRRVRVLAFAPALAATRYRPAQLLRVE